MAAGLRIGSCRAHAALSFEDGVLRVEVADAGWKSELQALAPRYLACINHYTTETVYRIEFVIAGPNI